LNFSQTEIRNFQIFQFSLTTISLRKTRIWIFFTKKKKKYVLNGKCLYTCSMYTRVRQSYVYIKPWIHVKIKLFQRIVVFYFNMEPRLYLYSCACNGRCTWIIDSRGTVQLFTSHDQEQIVSNVIEPMACDGLRTICIAYKDYVTGKSHFLRHFVTSTLLFRRRTQLSTVFSFLLPNFFLRGSVR